MADLRSAGDRPLGRAATAHRRRRTPTLSQAQAGGAHQPLGVTALVLKSSLPLAGKGLREWGVSSQRLVILRGLSGGMSGPEASRTPTPDPSPQGEREEKGARSGR